MNLYSTFIKCDTVMLITVCVNAVNDNSYITAVGCLLKTYLYIGMLHVTLLYF